jgi:RNA polymerase sigma-70 factor (ECF subfamily)
VAWSDEAAFSEFYNRAARALWAYVCRTTGNPADADDIVQEAFCRIAVADVDSLDDEGRRRYLFRIASNLVTDRWRRESREQSWRERIDRLVGVAPPPAPDAGVERAFGALKARERALLWLAYVEEYDHAEIAGALGLGRASVKVLLSRARERLREALKTSGIMGEHDG